MTEDALEAARQALAVGDHARVRELLATLPAELRDGEAARALERAIARDPFVLGAGLVCLGVIALLVYGYVLP